MSAATEKIADRNARMHARTSASARCPDDTPCDECLLADLDAAADPAVGWTPDTLHAFAQTFKGGDVSEMGDGDDPAVAARIAADARLRETTAERDALADDRAALLCALEDIAFDYDAGADALRDKAADELRAVLGAHRGEG